MASKTLASARFQVGTNFYREYSRSREWGFTLIELLIVIVIIVIVVAVGAVSYTTVARNTRDSQRKADLKKVQLALEAFYADFGAYPDQATHYKISCSTTGAPVMDGTGGPNGDEDPRDDGQDLIDINPNGNKREWGGAFTCGPSGQTKTYMSELPKDPIGNNWNMPGNPNSSSPRPGYDYEIREGIPPADIETGDPGTGQWCKTYLGGSCRKYTLWTRLENASDPEKYVHGQDETCDFVIDNTGNGDHHWLNGGGSVDDPATYFNQNPWYCVHSP